MAQIKKLQVQGIRSFGPGHEDRQNIEFFSPLTLILGQNGCGKTTIIECLKYVTTGDVPPGCGTGGSFVHDPKMAREAAVKGQVKMQFVVGKTSYVVVRSLEASQKIKNITVRTLDTTRSKSVDGGKATNISGKCADINADILADLGVSKPILNYVIFCHQEDSNWPLDVGSKVKDRFDEIFNSDKYKKCLENIKKVRAKEMAEAKLEKNDAQHFKSDKEYADAKRAEVRRKEKEAARLREGMARVEEELAPLNKGMEQVHEEEKGFAENQKLLAAAQAGLDHNLTTRENLEGSMGEVLREEVTDREIGRRQEGIDEETRGMEREMKKLEREKVPHENNMKKVENALTKNAAVIGKAVQEQLTYLGQEKEKEELVERAAGELDLADTGHMLATIKQEQSNVKNELEQIYADSKENERIAEAEVDKIKTKRAGLEAEKRTQQTALMNDKQEVAKLTKALSRLQGAASTLEQIRREWREGEERLEVERTRHDLPTLQQEIQQEKDTVAELEEQDGRLGEEARELEDKATALQRVAHITDDVADKREKMGKVMNRRRQQFASIFGKVPEPGQLKVKFKKQQEMSEDKMKALEDIKKAKDMQVNIKTSKKKELKLELDRKSAKLLEVKARCSEVVEAATDLEEEIEETKAALGKVTKELQVKEAGKFVYREQVELLRDKSSPCCPTCNRDFKKKGEVEEVVADLEARVAAIPAKVKSLEAKKVKQTTRLERLQDIRPSVIAMQDLEKEVAETKTQVEKLEKEVKKLQREVEEEDGELGVVEVTVTELKEVGEDVQTVEGLRREVEQLEEKLEVAKKEVGSQTSSRSLEEVRGEAAEVAAGLRAARTNLASAQDTVTGHSSAVNRLEAAQNLLTNRKLDIEGQQQAQASNQATKEEKEVKVLEHKAAVMECEQKLGPVKEELEEAEARRRKVREEGEATMEVTRDKERKLEGLRRELERVERDIAAYKNSGKEELLKKLKREKVEVEAQMAALKAEREALEAGISELAVQVANQGGRRRNLEDNLVLRGILLALEKHSSELEVQKAALEARNWGDLVKRKNMLATKLTKLHDEKAAMGGQQAEVERTVREMERELGTKKLKDAAAEFKKKTISHELKTKVASDLNKYYIALEFAIMKYHREKMKAVNKFVRELWLQVYKGNDIDFIKIVTDEPDQEQKGADKRKTYNYRVVMIKNDTELDMRGRCSAGQKVLACLIIRLALAETFSTNCGIIALDEPTTNLDRENIGSLAEALAELANKRAEQGNFQLVVITHDEDFIESLSRTDKLQYYQKVARTDRGLSKVTRHRVDNTAF